MKMLVNVSMYDKFKHRMMPAGDSKYSGFSRFWRRMTAALFASTITIGLSYPFDLFFTRIAADMGGKKQRRLYLNTFDCFNMTQLQGGYRALYNGASVALATAIPSALLMLPIYEAVQPAFATLSNAQDSGTISQVFAHIGPKWFTGFLTMMLLYPLDTIKRC
jgi:hypothetical protein